MKSTFMVKAKDIAQLCKDFRKARSIDEKLRIARELRKATESWSFENEGFILTPIGLVKPSQLQITEH
jgi:hypothetical protein